MQLELELLSKRWIVKAKEPILYLQIKDQLKKLSQFFNDRFNYDIIVKPLMIKLEKIPGRSEPWMGIQEFKDVMDYQLFCYVLVFLEDKENEQQFMLSELTEFIQANIVEAQLDWTSYSNRRQLIRVLKYCVEVAIISITDGNDDQFTNNENAEVLYENTGLSRYYARNFYSEINTLNSVDDFINLSWFEGDQDRGKVRANRVYRRLVLSAGVYEEVDDNEDFVYIRNYKNQIVNDFSNILPTKLHVHKTSAYLTFEDYKEKEYFPHTNAVDETILCLMSSLRKYCMKRIIDESEIVNFEINDFEKIIKKEITKIMPNLSKSFQDKPLNVLVDELILKMKLYGFIKQDQEQVAVYPIIGKINGEYEGGQKHE